MTGDETLTSGTSALLEKQLVGERQKYLSLIGYCPQFDSIIDVLTGREMLILFGRLRGIKDSKTEANKWLDALGKTISSFANEAIMNMLASFFRHSEVCRQALWSIQWWEQKKA